MTGSMLQGLSSVCVCLSELKLSKKAAAQTAADGASAASRKPPAGRRQTLSPPAAAVLVRRSDVCLSTFSRDCAESTDADADADADGRCQTGRDSRCTNKLKYIIHPFNNYMTKMNYQKYLLLVKIFAKIFFLHFILTLTKS